uniref:hypothetical protein n=1 Tax=Salmonella enterica TaxID=28901 RepID=UPI00398C4E39
HPRRTLYPRSALPASQSYLYGSTSTSFSIVSNLDVSYAVDLADGSRRSDNSATSTAWQYQICATTPLPPATQITLTSPQAMDDAIQPAKATNRVSLPMLTPTADHMRQPVPLAPFLPKFAHRQVPHPC